MTDVQEAISSRPKRKRTRKPKRNYDDEMPDAMPEERDIPEGPGEDK